MRTFVHKQSRPDEQEAIRVSDRVMRTPEPQGSGPAALRPSDAVHGTAPPIVDEVVRSPGEPLDRGARDFMERRFGHDFGRIRIHADRSAANASAELAADAFTFGHHIAFAHGRFAPGSEHGKRLVAHELTHAIQQAATRPHIALQPRKEPPGRSGVVGAVVGWTHANERVMVKREVGGAQGYADRLQAIAVARISKAEPAAIVLDTNKQWHAVEITADLEAGPDRTARGAMDASASEDSPFLAVYGLPSLTGIDQSRSRIAALRAKLAELDARKPTSEGDREAIKRETEQTRDDLAKANLNRARVILGVPESDIEAIGSLSSRVAGKVNIVGLPEKGSPGGGHAPLGGETGFEKGRQSAFWIDSPELDKPRAAETLFHEVSHENDWALAQAWVQKYETETKRLFVKSAPELFREWLTAQAKQGRLTKADAEIVSMAASDDTAYTEARANVRSFLADLQAGAPDLATKALVGYAHALKPRSQGGQYANPAHGSEVQAALVAELKAAYRQMPEPMRRQYDAAVAAARKENPSAWISELDFAKRAAR